MVKPSPYCSLSLLIVRMILVVIFTLVAKIERDTPVATGGEVEIPRNHFSVLPRRYDCGGTFFSVARSICFHQLFQSHRPKAPQLR